MRRSQILALVLLTAFALSAIAADSALAKEWLWNGAAITAALAFKIEGEVLVEDMKALPAVIDILCGYLFEGTVGPGSTGMITALLDLEGKDPLDCVAHELCEGALVAVTPVNLPWKTEIELKTNGEIRDIILGSPGYTAECKTIVGTFIDTCTGETAMALANEASDVFAGFSENETISPAGNCTAGGAKENLIISSSLATAIAGGTLSIS